jgi:hypothetical protein
MTRISRNKAVAIFAAVVCIAGVGLLLASPALAVEERRQRPEPMDPEKLAKVWKTEALCVAGATEVDKEKIEKVAEAYVAARKAYAEKVAELPMTREAFTQRRELATKAGTDLKAALTKIAGEEKAGKMVAALDPFAMFGSRLDRMIGGLMDFELPKEKFQKAVLSVIEYNRDLGKVMAEARESGSFEGMQEKGQKLTDSLNESLAKILSEEQMTKWKESYGRGFGRMGAGGRRPQAQ